jgi:hypothetical protein
MRDDQRRLLLSRRQVMVASTAASLAHAAPPPDPLAELPFRQDDPRWGSRVLWQRDVVVRVDTEFNGHPRVEAESLLRRFDDGNTLANEGCLLTCLAMVLRLLDRERSTTWTPATLDAEMQRLHFSTQSGLSVAPVMADLVSEVTLGAVQLTAKEEYLSGVEGRARVFPNTAALLRAFRTLEPSARGDVVVMLKTGTWDDTVASHYVLVHPLDDGGPDARDVRLLDPAQPLGSKASWKLTDSAQRIGADEDIAAAWKKAGIGPTQVGGVWLFSRGRPPAALLRAWAAASR